MRLFLPSKRPEHVAELLFRSNQTPNKHMAAPLVFFSQFFIRFSNENRCRVSVTSDVCHYFECRRCLRRKTCRRYILRLPTISLFCLCTDRLLSLFSIFQFLAIEGLFWQQRNKTKCRLNTLVVELLFRLKPTSGHAAGCRLVLTNKTLVEGNKLLLSAEKVGGI